MDDTSEHAAPETEERAPNVIVALTRVMRDLPGIGRDDTSEGQKYNYRGIEAITRHAQALLAKHGVVFVPRVVGREVKAFTLNGNPWTEDCLEVVYTVYGPGGIDDRIEVGPIVGLGRDNSDKGANKSMTQAFKYALVQTLCIGDGKDDPDASTYASDPEAARDMAKEERDAATFRIRQLTAGERTAFRDWSDATGLGNVVARWSDDDLAVAIEELDRLELARTSAPEPATEGQEEPYTSVSGPEEAADGWTEPETAGEATEAAPQPEPTLEEAVTAEVAAMAPALVKASLRSFWTAAGAEGMTMPKDIEAVRRLLTALIVEERRTVDP